MCLHPVSIYLNNKFDPQGTRNQLVPCGKCVECKKDYQNSWYVRFREESMNYSSYIFFTLTYNNDSVPYCIDNETGEIFNTVYKNDVQLWFKRFRSHLYRIYGERKKIKYFITSEYGPRTFRPHYHGLLWGVDIKDFRYALESWKKDFGFYTYSVLHNPDLDKHSSLALRYVAKYCSKGSFENPRVKEGQVNPTFHLISKGIGLSYVKKMRSYHLVKDLRLKKNEFIERLVMRMKYVIGKFTYKLPRYYKDKIYGVKTYLSFQIQNFLRVESDRLYNEKLESLQVMYAFSLSQACNQIVSEELQENERSYLQTVRSYSRFLERSQI